MLTLDRPALEEASAELDTTVRRTPEIDGFCSSSAWTFSADRAIMPPRALAAWRSEDGFVTLARAEHEGGRASLEPLEAAWCLASPFACAGSPRRLAAAFAREARAAWPEDVLFLAGLTPGSSLFDALVEALAADYRLTVSLVPPTRRFQASLAGGVDGFLSRRSTTFRAALRQATRKAATAGVRFEPVAVADEASARALYDRLLAVETRSWKGRAGDGLTLPQMGAFYAEMLPRLARAGSLRAHVGVRAGVDVAVIVGGMFDGPLGLVYRGLQFSFDDTFRPLSLGNLAQLAQITALAAEGAALYDLGSEVDYKRRWGERCQETQTLVALPLV